MDQQTFPAWQAKLREAQAEQLKIAEKERLERQTEEKAKALRDGIVLRDVLMLASIVDNDTPILQNWYEVDDWRFALSTKSDKVDVRYGQVDRFFEFALIVRRVMPQEDDLVDADMHGMGWTDGHPVSMRNLARERLRYTESPFNQYGEDDTAGRVFFHSHNTSDAQTYAEDVAKFCAALADKLDHLEREAQRYMPTWDKFVKDALSGKYAKPKPSNDPEPEPTTGERLEALIKEIIAEHRDTEDY